MQASEKLLTLCLHMVLYNIPKYFRIYLRGLSFQSSFIFASCLHISNSYAMMINRLYAKGRSLCGWTSAITPSIMK